MDKDLKSRTFAELERLVVELGQKKYLAGYIFSFIHTKGVADVSAITPLSKSFRSRLVEEGYYISALQVIEKLTDPDGTVKYVFGLSDGKRVESVLLFDSPREIDLHSQSRRTTVGSNISRGKGRRTLCISTQVGCAMACRFCATGRLGFARNLTAGEVVDQVNLVTRPAPARPVYSRTDLNPAFAETSDPSLVSRGTGAESRVTNVVFMGMGEPLANYDAVLKSVRILNHPAGRGIGIRHLTISTCGQPEGIERLADEDIQPRLAISLNAPTDCLRQSLMPIAKKYSLDRLFRAVELYQHKTHNRVTFEYCMIKGVNDTVLHARLLVKRLRSVRCNVNLIEYNPPPLLLVEDKSGGDLRSSGWEAIERFAEALRESGLETTVRRKYGQTIKAACGQLGAG